MRTAAACFVLAAAIATPGIVVAATSSSPGGQTASLTAPLVNVPVGRRTRIGPRLRPTVNAVTQALARTGVDLLAVPIGPHAAEGFELGTHGRCPVYVSFGLRLATNTGGPCPRGQVEARIGTIGFVPASLGPTIRAALAR